MMESVYYITGWGGNLKNGECGCGEVDRCDGGDEAKCNCDANDGEEREDKGLLINKDQLPISEVCLDYSNEPDKDRRAQYSVGELSCSPRLGKHLKCCSFDLY